MSELVLDFETASFADLGDVGSDIYSKDITTEILSLTWVVDDGEPQLWLPRDGLDEKLRWKTIDPNVMFVAHNAGFEKDIWRNIMVARYGFPNIPNERWSDVLAVCAWRTLPLALDAALSSLALPGKDKAASRFTIGLSKPNRKTGQLDRSSDSLAVVYAYNRSDVDIERALHKTVGYLPEMERRVWQIDQEINERGVKFDIPMVQGALKIRAAATAPLVHEFRELTGVNPTQVAKFKDWLLWNGVDLPSLAKDKVNALLGLADEENDGEDDEVLGSVGRLDIHNLPANVRRALTLRSLVGSASVAKYQRMAGCADLSDHRIRRLLQYHGAGTGRWAGRLFNAHNMPRGLARVDAGFDEKGRPKAKPPDPELLAAAITSGSVDQVVALGCFIEYGGNRVTANPIEVLASALRNTIIAEEGKHLLIGDWSAIEARLVLAIAGQHDKTALMASGADVYLSMAEAISGIKGLTKEHDVEWRQTGKNTVLGCGFQMGWEKFHQRYCPHQPEEFAKRAIDAYRKEWAPCVPKLWTAIQEAALKAVQSPGMLSDSGYGITYRTDGSWLLGECPDGSTLHYFRPTLCRRAMPWDPDDIRLAWRYQVPPGAKVNSFGGGDSGRWVSAYGGLLTENYIQHMARQLLCRALGLCRKAGLPVILHNQDEIIVEHHSPDVAALKQIMEDRPPWAVAIQLPLAAECHKPTKRYFK